VGVGELGAGHGRGIPCDPRRWPRARDRPRIRVAGRVPARGRAGEPGSIQGSAAIRSPEPEPATDGSIDLVRRIQAGDAAAWDALYLRYRDRLLLSIRCRLGAKLRARLQSEDILHSVFRDALSDIHRFEPHSPQAVNHYLHTCTLNKIRSKADYFGAQKRTGEVPLTDSIIQRIPNPAGAEPRYADPVRYARLEAALARLADDMREVVLLRTVEGLPNREAAEVLGRSPEAASKLYNRALAKLAILLQERA
jgi:RNA polymerase sigma-70 factor (ECF subfamily)